MFIGRLAHLTGCTPKAIRLYEQMGLINPPQRSGRYRVYNAHHVQMVHLIRKAQVAGFKLAEMAPLLAAKQVLKAFPLGLTNEAVDAKRLELQASICALQALDVHLAGLKSQMNEMFGEQVHTAEPGACPDRQTLHATPVAVVAG